VDEATGAATDTNIAGLTYVFASNHKELDNLVTREFHADPNLHKNPSVSLVGDFATEKSPAVAFEWTWKWKSPTGAEERNSGFRNTCSVCSMVHNGYHHIDKTSLSNTINAIIDW